MRWRDLLAAAVDLVLPADCPGCGTGGTPWGLCASCAERWSVRPRPARPQPAPEGLPACVSAAAYEAPWRGVILEYKDGRRGLAGLLGDALARAIAAGSGPGARAWPLALVPVPATPAAIRARHGDHMRLLARHAARRLRTQGWQVRLLHPLRALPKPDSGHLDRAARVAAARGGFVLRPSRLRLLRAGAEDATVIVLDDVLTTGATIAAVAQRLREGGAPVAFAATIAATRRRTGPGRGSSDPVMLAGIPDSL